MGKRLEFDKGKAGESLSKTSSSLADILATVAKQAKKGQSGVPNAKEQHVVKFGSEKNLLVG